MFTITKGKIPSALKCVIYGPEGIGKSTFASRFPDPLFIDTEGSTKHMNVDRLDAPSSWTLLMQEVQFVKSTPGLCKTLVIDTADWAEQLCNQQICAQKNWGGIEDAGWGKGYTYLAEEFGKLLNLLEDVVRSGINVVVTAHAQMRKFEQPDELGSYDRWELKLQKKTAAMVKEWADMVLFANYKTIVVNVDGQGAIKGKNKAQGAGQRVMYTTHHSCWDAKNRHGLPDELPFDFGAIAHLFADQAAVQPPIQQPIQAPIQQPVQPPVVQVTQPVTQPTQPLQMDIAAGEGIQEGQIVQPDPQFEVDYTGIPQSLLDLMKKDNIMPMQIQRAVAERNYYPVDTPISNYDPMFIEAKLVGAWDQVLNVISHLDLPF